MSRKSSKEQQIPTCYFVLFTVVIVLFREVAGETSKNTFQCSSSDVIVIRTNDFRAGLLETPNFPEAFTLPLKCGWIIDNSARKFGDFIHLYFTQFYLRPGLLGVSLHTNLESAKNWLTSDNVDKSSVVDEGYLSWHRQSFATTNISYVAVKLDIHENEDYGNLHLRALEVYEPFGFRVAFEIGASPRKRPDSCSLIRCKMNGECIASIDEDGSGVKFACECALPNRPSRVDRPFEGPYCGAHNIPGECNGKRSMQRCSGNGVCSYLTSRHVVCECDDGFAGKHCEKKEWQQHGEQILHRHRPQEKCTDPHIVVQVPRRFETVTDFLIKDLTKRSESIFFFRRADYKISGEFLVAARNIKILLPIFDRLLELNNGTVKSMALGFIRHVRIESGICTKDIMVQSSSSIIEKGSKFQVICVMRGPKPLKNFPKAIWIKDDVYQIDANVAQRKIDIISQTRPISGNEYEIMNSVIFHSATKRDSGVLKCDMKDNRLNDLELFRDGNWTAQYGNVNYFTSTVSLSTNIEIANSPGIEVFPRTLTVIVGAKIAQTTFSVGSGIGSEVELLESVFIPYMGEDLVYGKILRLGNLQSDANYTCVVENLLFPSQSLKSDVTVNVFVAESENQVCHKARDTRVWPMTKEARVPYKGTTSIRECPHDEDGFLKHKCLETSPSVRPVWDSEPDDSDCIQKSISSLLVQLEDYFSGYDTKMGSHPVQTFFESISKRTHSRLLHEREWNNIADMSRRILQHIKEKNDESQIDPIQFYPVFVSWLLKYGVENAKNKNTRFVDLFDLVYESAVLFTRRGRQPRSEIGTFSLGNGKSGADKEKCIDDADLIVAFAQMQSRAPDIGVCTDLVPNVIMRTSDSHEDPLSYAIIYSKLLDSLFMSQSHDLYDDQGRKFVLRSPIVTVAYEKKYSLGIEETPVQYEIRYANVTSVTDMDKMEMFCVRLNLHNSVWILNSSSSCESLRNGSDITCICSFPGPVAIIHWTGPIEGWVLCCSSKSRSDRAFTWRSQLGTSKQHKSNPLPELPNMFSVSISCGGSMAICIVTFCVLMKQIWRSPRCSVLHIEASIAAMSVFVMGFILLVTEYPQSFLTWWTSVALQVILMEILALQICLEALLQVRIRSQEITLGSKILAIVLSLVIPLAYAGVMIGMQNRERRAAVIHDCLTKHEPLFPWFAHKSSPDLIGFTLINSLLFATYFILFCWTKGVLTRAERLVYPEIANREAVLNRSLAITISLAFFDFSIILFVNLTFLQSLKLLLCFSAMLLGTMIFLGYLISSDGYIKDITHFGELKFSKARKNKKPPVLGNPARKSVSGMMWPRRFSPVRPAFSVDGIFENNLKCNKCRSKSSLWGFDFGFRPKSRSVVGEEDGSDRGVIGARLTSCSKCKKPFRTSPYSTHSQCSSRRSSSSVSARVRSSPGFIRSAKRLSDVEDMEDQKLEAKNETSIAEVHACQEVDVSESKTQSELNEPVHLTDIVQQAQQEAAVDLITQISDGSLSKNIVKSKNIVTNLHVEPDCKSLCHSDTSDESGYIQQSSGSRRNTSFSCSPSSEISVSGPEPSFFGYSYKKWDINNSLATTLNARRGSGDSRELDGTDYYYVPMSLMSGEKMIRKCSEENVSQVSSCNLDDGNYASLAYCDYYI